MVLLRLAESRGCHLEAILDRENLILYAEALKEDIEFVAKIFSETLSTFHWEEHEIEAAKIKITLEALRAEASARNVAMEAAHREIFGFHGLGSSLLCSSWRASELNQEKLSSFKRETLKSISSGPLYSLTAFGVELGSVKALNSTYFATSMKEFVSQQPAEMTKNNGKTVDLANLSTKTLHLERDVNDTVLSVAFAIPGFGGKSIIENLRLLILKEAFYAPSPIPYGTSYGKWMGKSHLNGAIMKLTPEFHQYSDAGIFGFTLSIPLSANIFHPDKILVETVQPLLQEQFLVDISEAQFKAAKAAVKLQLAECPEKIRSFAIGIGKLLSKNASTTFLPSIVEMMQAIDTIGIDAIKTLQKSIFSKTATPVSIIVGPTLSGVSI